MTSEKDLISNDWQSTKSTVMERVSHLYNNDAMSDVTFLVKNENSSSHCRILAHKLFLAARSSVFNAMFNGPMA